MAKLIIKVEKDDILASAIGCNIQIDCGNITIVFSRDALDELLKDYKSMPLIDTEK